MKKLGKKFSFLTKILLVVGLLISNLSSLSIVFAYEVSDDLIITLNGTKLEISYTEQVAEEVENVDVKVYEKYLYSEDLTEETVVTEFTLEEEQVLALKEGTLELVHDSIFANGDEVANYEIFDGTYNVRVEIIDMTVYEEVSESEEDLETVLLEETEGEFEGTLIASNSYEKEMLHAAGLNIKLFDAETDEEISLVDGKYPVDLNSSKVKVVAQVLPGGFRPDDIFMVEDEELLATEMITKVFVDEVEFVGHLFGEHQVDVEVKLLKEKATEEVVIEEETENTYEEIIYSESVVVMYGEYSDNADVLNDVASDLELNDKFVFYGEEKDGSLYVISSFDEVSVTTMADLYDVLVAAIGDTSITYTLEKDGVNVIEAYDETSEVSLEDYLASIEVDESVVVTLSCGDLVITYNVVELGDFNGDNLITEEDLIELINQVVGVSEITNINKSDLWQLDGKVNTLDVLYLNKVIENKNWETDLSQVQGTLNSKLNVLFNEEALSEENYLVSGDKFTVDYVLSLTDYEVNGVAGLFDYDKSVFELLSLNINYEWLGNNHDGKFLYLGEEVLTMPELEEIPEDEVEVVSEEETEEVLSNDYVLISLTFKAIKATENSVITLKDIELFNTNGEETVYYELENNTVSTEGIEVKASDDFTLSYLAINTTEIELVDGVYDYEVTVDHLVTTVDVKYILNNVAASVTSIVCPEELVEGDNTVIITVVSESGLTQDYTINVIKEKAPEPTTPVYNDTYYGDNNDEEIVVTPGTDTEEEIPEEKDGTLSRIVIIILILVVIGGLVYLIFRDEEDAEVKKANKDINKLKKESIVPEEKEVVKTVAKVTAAKATAKTTTKTTGTKTAAKTSTKSTPKTTSAKGKGSKK